MLPKKNRIDKKRMDLIFKKGAFISSSLFTFKFILEKNISNPKIAFVAPKNIAKLAVKRNLLRRKGYSVLKKYIKLFPSGLSGAFVFKKIEEDILKIENEIKTILNKIY